MAHHPLARVILASRHYPSHITGLYSIIAVLIHKVEGAIDLALVISRVGAGLMMHDKLHPARRCVGMQLLDVEVRVGPVEAEQAVPFIGGPVFPTFVPAFHKHASKAVVCGEVYVLFDILRSGPVAAVRLQATVVRKSRNGAAIPAVVPGFANPHKILPPDSDILNGMNPGGVFYLARLVQIVNQAACKYVCCLVAHNHGSPRCGAWGHLEGLLAILVRNKVGGEDKIPVIDVELHCRKIDKRRFVNVHVQAVVTLEHHGRLNDKVPFGFGLVALVGKGLVHKLLLEG